MRDRTNQNNPFPNNLEQHVLFSFNYFSFTKFYFNIWFVHQIVFTNVQFFLAHSDQSSKHQLFPILQLPRSRLVKVFCKVDDVLKDCWHTMMLAETSSAADLAKGSFCATRAACCQKKYLYEPGVWPISEPRVAGLHKRREIEWKLLFNGLQKKK